MIFAILFFLSFVIGLITFLGTDRWWIGGVACSLILIMISVFGLISPDLRGVALYFGIPIVFLGCLFGAYVVQLRRAPDLNESDNKGEISGLDSSSTLEE